MRRVLFLVLILLFIAESLFFGYWLVRMDGWNKLSALTSYIPGGWTTWMPSPENEDIQTFSENLTKVNDSIAQSLEVIPPTLAEELQTSRLYLMLANKDGGYTRSFVFDDGKFTPSENQERSDLFYTFSQDGKKLAFLALPFGVKVLGGSNWGELAQVFVADTQSAQGAYPNMQEVEQLTDNSFPYKQYLSVSNGGAVLFNVGEHVAQRETERADDFAIYLSTNATTTYIVRGFQPQWISDSEFLFLKNDGMYKAIRGSEPELMIARSPEAPVHKNEKFKVSADASTIVWTMANEEKMLIYTKDQQGKYVLSKTLAFRGLQPEFSPSGNFLAFYTAKSGTGGVDEEAMIRFYDMTTFTEIKELVIPLSDFNPRAIFINDWVRK